MGTGGTRVKIGPTTRKDLGIPIIDLSVMGYRISDFVNLNDAITTIGNVECRLYIDATTSVSGNCVVPKNIDIEIVRGNFIDVGNYNLTINGTLNCDAYHIFLGAGSIVLGSSISEVYPEWWGAVGDGITDDTLAIQKAINSGSQVLTGFESAATLGNSIVFSKKTYCCTTLTLYGYRKYIGNNTTLKSLVSNESAFIKITNDPVLNLVFENISLLGNLSNSYQHGLYLKTDTPSIWSTGGIWYSTFSNIQITNFTGNSIHSSAIDNNVGYDIANQFLIFNNVRAFRENSTLSRSLYVEGQFGQIQFNNCEFDSTYPITNNTVNVEFSLQPNISPSDEFYSIDFNCCTFQGSQTAVLATYAHKLNFNGCHFEELQKCLIFHNSTIAVDKCYFANSANFSGNGFLVGAYEGTSLTFTNNTYTGITDKLIDDNSSYGVISYGNVPKGISITSDVGYITFSSGVSLQSAVTSGGVLYAGGAKTVLLSGLGNVLKTIKSYLGIGETITIKAWYSSPTNSTVEINDTGNITLPSYCKNNKIILHQGDTITLVKTDLVGNWWIQNISREEKYNTTYPTGTNEYWEQGDYIRNSNPAIGQPKGWICTISGIPGTWVSEGNL